MTKTNFTQRFWSSVNKAMREKQMTYREVAQLAGIKRTTFIDAKCKKTPLSFVNSILVLRALNIPTYLFTVKLIKEVEKHLDEEHKQCELQRSIPVQPKAL